MESHQPHVSDGLLSGNRSTKPGRDTVIESFDSISSRSSPFTPQNPSFISPALKAWSFDLGSCAIAVIALAAIVITLAIHKDDSLPSWPLGITVNALISVFAVLFKVSLLAPVAGAISQLKWSWFRESRPLIDIVDFDNASRGNVWSAAVLIVKTGAIKIPALGGLIIIAAIAVDPFIQQVVRYEPCPQPLPGALATVARTNNYTRSGIHTGAMLESLDAPMQAAIYTGAYDSWSKVSPTCTTGNCTFPEFRSLGMCSQCENITSEILYTPVDRNISGPAWSLPSGLWVNGVYILNMTSSTSNGLTSLLSTEVIAVTNYSAIPAATEDASTMNRTHVKPGPWNPEGPNFVVAARCTLQPCVQTTRVQVNANKLTETTLSTSEMQQQTWEGGEPAYSWTASPMPCLANGSYFEASAFTESNVTNSTNQWPVPGLLPNNKTAWLPDECFFVYADTLGLTQYLEQYLKGWYLVAPEAEGGEPAFIEQMINTPIEGDESSNNMSTGSSLELINGTWVSIAGAISAHIRTSGNVVNSAPAAGVTLHMDTCLRVRWRWLSYPIVLLFLTLILVTVTAARSFGRSTTHQLWRASPLALLFHGLDEKTRRRVRDIEHRSDMERIATGVYARLKDDGAGPEFQCIDRGSS